MVDSLEVKIRHLNAKFQKDGFKIDRDWLHGCTEHFVSNEPDLSVNELYAQAKEQWLLANICDGIGVKCLPDLSEKGPNFEINGRYVLQLQYLLDISESCYDQLRKIHNKILDEADDEKWEQKQNQALMAKKRRVLKLELTDGYQTCHALEYQPIPFLNTQLSPGCKVLLTGPIRYINKLLFIEMQNIKILGGEVDQLQIQNAYENVLLRQLGKPIVDNPKLDYNEPEVRPVERKAIPKTTQQMSVTITNASTLTSNISDDMFGDDEIMMDINMEMIEEECNRQTTDTRSNINRSPNEVQQPEMLRFLDDDFVIDTVVENVIDRTSQERLRSHSDPMELLPNDSVEEISYTIIDDQYQYKIDNINLARIHQLHLLPDLEKRNKIFVLKAELSSMTEKLSVKGNEWFLGVQLNDGSEHMLQVRISSECLEKLSGRSPNEMNLMRASLVTQPQLREDMMMILRNLASKLDTLNCFMKISYSSDQPYPVVTELLDSNQSYEDVMNAKLSREHS